MNKADSDIQIDCTPARDQIEAIGAVWRALQSRSVHSYFTSWSWIRCWLETLPDAVEPHFITLSRNDSIVGCFLICTGRQRDRRFLPRRRSYLNATGRNDLDEITIELNGPLLDPSFHGAIDLFRASGISNASSLVLHGVTDSALAAFSANQQFVRTIKSRPCHYVDLRLLEGGRQPYSKLLSGNKRRQIRVSHALYEQTGPVQLEFANSTTEALEMLSALEALHTEMWQRRGRPGAFSEDYFRSFHGRLVKHQFDAGEIQLVRIRNSEEVLGYLYNFLYQNTVLQYQTAFTYKSDNRFRPGYLAHSLAIEHNANLGFAEYNFLAGDAQYKKSLATDCRQLHWAEVYRPSALARAELWASRLIQLLRTG